MGEGSVQGGVGVVARLAPEALCGLPGEIVTSIGPHTEADPAALLVSLLAAAGAVLDQDAHVHAGDARHPARLWPLIIGPTSGGMKGTSWNAIKRVILAADPGFAANIEGGLSSGEGLIERIRDPHGEPDDKDFDEGVPDKRLLVIEPEFGAVLGRAKREGNVLSETLRSAWDGGRLSTMTRKSSRLVATGAHIAVIGHVTPTELRAKLSETDVAGGLINRFLPVASRRSKRLPDGGSAPDDLVEHLGARLAAAIDHGRSARRVSRDRAAATLWRSIYAELTPDDLPDGHYAAVIARAVPQVLRLALTYALLDERHDEVLIRVEHLRAALAIWDYVTATAAAIFGDLGANRDLTKLTTAIDAAGDHGLPREAIVKLFDGHKSRDAIDEMLRQLLAGDDYREIKTPTKGRPVTRYVREKLSKRDKPPDDPLSSLTYLPSHHESTTITPDSGPRVPVADLPPDQRPAF